MLPKEYSAWVKQDPGIPGLATLLDPEAFQKCLQPIVRVEKVWLRKLWYEPETYCLAAYQMEFCGAPAYVYAKAYAPYGANKIRKTLEQAPAAPAALPQKVVLEKVSIAVFFFPADDQLASLTHLAEPEKRTALLRDLFPEQADFWEGNLHPLQYKPERRYVVRLDTPKGPQAVLKFCRHRVFSESLTAAKAFKSQGALRVPQCLGFSRLQNCLVFEWLPGRPLKKVLHRDLQSAVPLVKNSGAALAELHGQKVAGLACLEENSSIESVAVEAGKLGLFSPALKVKIERLENAIIARLAEQPPIRRPIHGSFHLSQVLVDNNKLGVIDFDDSVLGDPRQDLGRFIASLHQSAIRGKIPENCLGLLTQAFLNGYRQNSGDPVPTGLEAHVAAALFKPPNLHPSSPGAGESDWSGLIHATLDRAEAILEKPF
ncbi:MAG: aminoglycoside phosphotransferase family protein [Nitrospinales bacterium]